MQLKLSLLPETGQSWNMTMLLSFAMHQVIHPHRLSGPKKGNVIGPKKGNVIENVSRKLNGQRYKCRTWNNVTKHLEAYAQLTVHCEYSMTLS